MKVVLHVYQSATGNGRRFNFVGSSYYPLWLEIFRTISTGDSTGHSFICIVTIALRF